MLTSPHIESTLSHIISPCSLQPLLPQFSIAAIKIAAKNQAVLSLAPGTHLHGFSLLPHTPVGVLVVKVYCQVEQLSPGGAGVLAPTRHPLHPAYCPLVQSIGGENLLGHTPSLPSLTPLTHTPGAPLLLLILLRLQKGQRGRQTLLRGRGVLFTLYDVDDGGDKYDNEDNFILQPKTLRTTCSLLKKQQNSLRSTVKNS